MTPSPTLPCIPVLSLLRSFTDTTLNTQFVAELLVTSVLANTYDAIMRSFLCRVIRCLKIPLHSLISLEQSLLSTLVLLADHLSKDTDQIAEETKKVSKRGKWLKVGAAAAAGSLLVLAAPALVPAASTLLTSLAGISTFLGGAAALSAALSATAAFLSTSAGLAVFSAGVLAGGASYAGLEKEPILTVETRCDADSPATSMAQLSQRAPNRRSATVSTCFSSTAI